VPIPGAIAGLIQPRLLILTNAALYIMERTVPEEGANPDGLLQPPTKSLPWFALTYFLTEFNSVVLRRRIPLTKNTLQKVVLTSHADSTLALICAPHVPLPSPRKDHWIEDNQV
jgi:hypothetical protein